MRYKPLLVLTAVLPAIAALFLIANMMKLPSPVGEASRDDRPVVGYVETESDGVWWDNVNASIRRAAEERDIQLIVIPCDHTQESQKEAIRSLIAYRADVIIFTPVLKTGWSNVILEAEREGIPILTFMERLSAEAETGSLAYIGPSYEELGQKAKAFIADRFKRRAEPVRFAELCGPVGSYSSITIRGELRKGLRSYANSEIVLTVSAENMASKAEEALSSFLISRKGRDLPDVVFAFNDSMTSGAVKAIEKNGLLPDRDILILSFGGGDEAEALLKEGRISWLFSVEPDCGPKVLDRALTLMDGKPFDTYLHTEILTVSQDTPSEGGA